MTKMLLFCYSHFYILYNISYLYYNFVMNLFCNIVLQVSVHYASGKRKKYFATFIRIGSYWANYLVSYLGAPIGVYQPWNSVLFSSTCYLIQPNKLKNWFFYFIKYTTVNCWNSKSQNSLYENAIDQAIWGYKWGYIYIVEYISLLLSIIKAINVADSLRHPAWCLVIW